MPTHRKPESERFRGPGKWLQYLLARGLVTLLQRLPVTWAWHLGRSIGWVCWSLMSGRRAVVRKNLEIVNAWMGTASGGDAGDRIEHRTLNIERRTLNIERSTSSIEHRASNIDPQVREVFQRAGANLLSGFPLSRLPVERLAEHLEASGAEHLRAAMEQGRGVIVLLAHMGPWEALAHLPGMMERAELSAPLGAMYRPLNNAYLDAWVRSLRQAKGTRLFSRRDGFHRPVDFIRAGGVLGILADQRMRQGLEVPLFGKPVATSTVPGLFHLRSKAPFVGVSIKTIGRCTWALRFHPVPLVTSFPEESPLLHQTRVVSHMMETLLGSSPLDGFWFSRRFEASRRPPKRPTAR